MNWPTVKLKNVANILMGQSPPGDTYNRQGDSIPFFQGKVDFGDKYPTVRMWCTKPLRIAEAGDILLSVRAPVGPTNIADRKCCIGRGLAAIRPLDSNCLNPEFLRFVFKWVEPSITRKGQGSTFSAIKRKDVDNIEFPFPAPSEQRRIVEILDQADALRKKRAEADEMASRILQALFYEMFGDPATNPKGWPTQRLQELFEVNGGGTPSKSITEYWKGQMPWVSPKDMKNDKIFDTEDHITEEAIRNSATRLVPKGSVLIVYRSGILAHSFPVAFAGRDVTINQDLKALTSKGEVRNEYLFGVLTANASLGLSCVKKGATVHNIDGSRFLGLDIPKPPERLQQEFAKRLSVILEYKRDRHTAGTSIDKLFKTLLYHAFDGSLTAKWRESHMEELLAEMEEQAKALEKAPSSNSPKKSTTKKRHGGHNMYNKAALAAYITDRCHSEEHPMGRVKLAKLFYLSQRKAEIRLTDVFVKRAAGPLDDQIHKFLNLAKKQQWVELDRARGDFKPVRPGKNLTKVIPQVQKLLAVAKADVDSMLDDMKGWKYTTLERWATVLEAAEALREEGNDISVDSVKSVIFSEKQWAQKLDRAEFSDEHIRATLTGLKRQGFLK